MNSVSKDEYSLFFDRGFCVIPKLISREKIVDIQRDISCALMEGLKQVGHLSSENEGMDTLYAHLKVKSANMKSRVYDILGRLQSVQQVFLTETMSNLSRTILGSPAVIDGIRVRIDDSSNDRLLPLHQELNQMSLINMTVWIPLSDTSFEESGGGIIVVPGSHKGGFVEHQLKGEQESYWGVASQDDYAEQKEFVELKAGDGLIFHPLLIHGSSKNDRNTTRWTLIARLNSLHSLRRLQDGEDRYPLDRADPLYTRYEKDLTVRRWRRG